MTTPEELFSKSEFDYSREHPEYHETVRTSDWLKGEVHNGRNVTHIQKPFPGLEFTHFPNEGAYGKQGHFAKRMGVRKDIQDFIFWWALEQTGFIELKIDDNKQSSGQRDFDSKLAELGFKHRSVCYSTEEIRDTLIGWYIPYVYVPIPPRKPTMAEKRNFALEMLRP
jgi:hypothetical protein